MKCRLLLMLFILLYLYRQVTAEHHRTFTLNYVCDEDRNSGYIAKQCADWQTRLNPCPVRSYGKVKPCTGCYVPTEKCPEKSKTSREYTCTLNIGFMCEQFNITCFGITHCDLGCHNHYRCLNGDCVIRQAVCDADTCNDCAENTEWPAGVGFKCSREGSQCILPQQMLYDNVQDCDTAVDLCYPSANQAIVNKKPSTGLDTSICFQCEDGKLIIPLKLVCDGLVDCMDLSDECLCESSVPEICRHIAMHKPLRSFSQPAEVLQCSPTQLSCGNGQCVDAFNVMCDSIGDCYNNRDERIDYCGTSTFCVEGIASQSGEICRCQKQGNCHANKGVLCNMVADCPLPQDRENLYQWLEPPGYPEDECVANCPNRKGFGCTGFWFNLQDNARVPQFCTTFTSEMFAKTYMSSQPSLEDVEKFNGSLNATDDPIGTTPIQLHKFELCNGLLLCKADYKDELNCSDRYYCRSGDLYNIEMNKKCNGFRDCDSGIDEAKTTCPNRIFCSALGGAKVSIPPTDICNYIIDCDDESDEMNCTDGRFYCEDGNPLFVHKDKMFNGVNNCGDWSDECPSIPVAGHNNIFASRYDLIGNPILRYLVWIMALLAIAGNGVVLLYQISTIRKQTSENKACLIANHLLVLNLAIADLLMGFYLLLLGGYGTKYAGRYCSVSLEWLSSHTCTAMGILVFLSSENSVITLALLSSFRMYSIYKPFETSKPSRKTVSIFIAISWSIAILIAFIPLSSLYVELFANKALISKHPHFRSTVVEFSAAKTYALKLFTFNPTLVKERNMTYRKILSATSWNDLPVLNHSRYFGFYSSQSVCLPKIFVTTDDKDWIYSIIVVSFNFACFIYICVTHILVGHHLANQTPINKYSRKNSKHHKAISDLQRRIIRLVVTDFCCWVPIFVMAIINVSVFKLPGFAYAFSAIVLLPINSALNPILYSNAIEKVYKIFHR